MSLVPDITPGAWNQLFIKGTTWPSTTVAVSRGGAAVIPVSASLFIYSPDGDLLETFNATIDGGGVMTVGPVSAASTAAFTWDYGNSVLRMTESGSVVTDILAGNATVRNYAE